MYMYTIDDCIDTCTLCWIPVPSFFQYMYPVHCYSTSENVIKIFRDFGAIFWKKPWAIALGTFQKLAYFLKWQ